MVVVMAVLVVVMSVVFWLPCHARQHHVTSIVSIMVVIAVVIVIVGIITSIIVNISIVAVRVFINFIAGWRSPCRSFVNAITFHVYPSVSATAVG